MSPEIIKYLSQENPGKLHDDLLEKVKGLVDLSRGEMEKEYDKWDRYDMMWRAEREPDEQDRKAAERKEPVKLSIPITHSQIETFVAFCVQIFTQRPSFYELSGVGTEDIKAAKIGEATLDYNLDYNRFKGEKLQQFIRNIAKFGLGIIKHSWCVKTTKVPQQVPMPVAQIPGQPPVQGPIVEQLVDTVVYKGNEITVTSPYRFFPDPRVPITRFQDGEFCASEDDYSKHQLSRLEKQGTIAGLQYVGPFAIDAASSTKRRIGVSLNDAGSPSVTRSSEVSNFVVTEVQIEIVPAEWEISDGVPLSPSKEYEKWLIWYANDNRIIRIEPMGYLHNEFTYVVSQFCNDNLRFLNLGIAELLQQMEDTQNFFINSHITSIRKIISNLLVVDPKGIDMKDLEARRPVLKLLPAAQGSGDIQRWIYQLNLQDVTSGHMNDAGILSNFAKETTGITENILGQFASGRRSATEARNVANNAAARLLIVANSIWEVALKPLGKQLLSNLRDGMDVPQLVKVIGQSNVLLNQDGVAEFIKVDKTQLVGSYDFLPFDGTLPSLRAAMAEQLQELLMAMMSNPQIALVFQLNPRTVLNEMLYLRGIRNIDQFTLDPVAAQNLIGLASFARNAANVVNSGGAGAGPAQANSQQPPAR